MKLCGDCDQFAFPLAGKDKEGIFFCKKKGSRVLKTSKCGEVPVGRYFYYIDNPLDLVKLKEKLGVIEE